MSHVCGVRNVYNDVTCRRPEGHLGRHYARRIEGNSWKGLWWLWWPWPQIDADEPADAALPWTSGESR